MTFSIEIGGSEGSPNRDITPDELGPLDAVHPHTAVGDFEAEIPWEPSIRNREFEDVRIYEDGSIKWRGKLLSFDWNENQNMTRLAGEGVLDELQQFGTAITYTDIPTHEAIYDFWARYWWNSFFSDGFEDGDTAGWTASGGTLSAQQTIVNRGSWAAELDNSGGGSQNHAEHTFSSNKSEVHATAAVRFDTADGIEVQLLNGSTTGPKIRANGGTWEYYDDTAWVDTGITADTDTWYEFELVADAGDDEYHVYIDNTFVTHLAAFDNALADMDAIRFLADDGAKIYFDRVGLSESNVTVYEPDVTEIETATTAQLADTTLEFQDIVSIGANEPVQINSGRLESVDTAFVHEGENYDSGIGGGNEPDTIRASDGEYIFVFDSTHDPAYDFTLDYDMPGSNTAFAIRFVLREFEYGDGGWGLTDISYKVDGTELTQFGGRGTIGPGIARPFEQNDPAEYVRLDDGGTFTDLDDEAKDAGDDDVPLLPASPAVGDALYIGASFNFAGVGFDFSQVGSGTYDLVWEYYNGSSWTSISGKTASFSDNTGDLTSAGDVTWNIEDMDDWADTFVDGQNARWIRARVDSFSSLSTQPRGHRVFERWPFYWFEETSQDLGSDLQAGSHTFELDCQGSAISTGIDVVAFYDDRFSYSFPDTLDQEAGHLDGPETKPDSYTFQFDQFSSSLNVVGINVVLETLAHEGIGAVEVSYDGGSTWVQLTADLVNDDDTFTDDNGDNVGQTIDSRVEFTRYGSATGQTPLTGVSGGQIDVYETQYDGTDLSTIEDQTFRGSGFEIIQELHRKADFRFVLDYADRDNNNDFTNAIESFETGDQSKTASWVVKNRRPSRSVRTGGYANHVTVRGKLQSDGTRPTATVQEDSEITALGGDPNDEPPADGFRHYDVKKPGLDTLKAVESEARKVLTSKVGRSNSGVLDIVPQFVLPGYDYSVDWFNDGNPTDTALKKVTYTEEHGDASGELTFSEPQDITISVVELGFKQADTARAV